MSRSISEDGKACGPEFQDYPIEILFKPWIPRYPTLYGYRENVKSGNFSTQTILDAKRREMGRIPSFLRWPHCFLRVANFLPPGPPDRMAPAVKIHDPVVSLVVFRTTELENIVGVRGIPPSP